MIHRGLCAFTWLARSGGVRARFCRRAGRARGAGMVVAAADGSSRRYPTLGPDDEAWSRNPIDRVMRRATRQPTFARTRGRSPHAYPTPLVRPARPAARARRRRGLRAGRRSTGLRAARRSPAGVTASRRAPGAAPARDGALWRLTWLRQGPAAPQCLALSRLRDPHLNEDKPYSRFAQEQIAGDVLFPGTRDGIEGLGFIAAGPWDQIGHKEIPEPKVDGKIARLLDRDDMVSNTMNTFVSMTVQRAAATTTSSIRSPRLDWLATSFRDDGRAPADWIA